MILKLIIIVVKWRKLTRHNWLLKGIIQPNIVSGDNDGEDTPVPIPNTEVKLSSADDT